MHAHVRHTAGAGHALAHAWCWSDDHADKLYIAEMHDVRQNSGYCMYTQL